MPRPTNRPPFEQIHQLYHGPHGGLISSPLSPRTLPGHPRVLLHDTTGLAQFLQQELWATDLERMAPHLWIMSTQSYASIYPLHAQRQRRREIVVTEDPRLHLVWIYDRVFIKPLPRYLLSYDFWQIYLLDDASPIGGKTPEERQNHQNMCRAALGFLRTYFFLITHESDFELACRREHQLLPTGVTWDAFCEFSADFKDIDNDTVSGRYQYGELRLTRLNLYIKILLRKLEYERVHAQYGDYFARFYGPLLFVFGIISIVLSAMQVQLGVETLVSSKWSWVWYTCRWAAVVILIGMVVIALALAFLLMGMIGDEWLFALKQRYLRKKGSRSNA